MPSLLSKRRISRVRRGKTITKGDIDYRYGHHITTLMYKGRIEAFETARFMAQFGTVPDNDTLAKNIEIIQNAIEIENGAFAVCKELDEYYNRVHGNLRLVYYVSTPAHSNLVVYRSPWRPNCLNLFVYQDKSGANDESYYIVNDIRKFFYGHIDASGLTYCVDCNTLCYKRSLENHTKRCPNMCHSCFRWGIPALRINQSRA